MGPAIQDLCGMLGVGTSWVHPVSASSLENDSALSEWSTLLQKIIWSAGRCCVSGNPEKLVRTACEKILNTMNHEEECITVLQDII